MRPHRVDAASDPLSWAWARRGCAQAAKTDWIKWFFSQLSRWFSQLFQDSPAVSSICSYGSEKNLIVHSTGNSASELNYGGTTDHHVVASVASTAVPTSVVASNAPTLTTTASTYTFQVRLWNLLTARLCYIKYSHIFGEFTYFSWI